MKFCEDIYRNDLQLLIRNDILLVRGKIFGRQDDLGNLIFDIFWGSEQTHVKCDVK